MLNQAKEKHDMDELSGIERDDREDRAARRQKQQVDVALALTLSYKEWKQGTLQGISIKRAAELTNELFDELDHTPDG